MDNDRLKEEIIKRMNDVDYLNQGGDMNIEKEIDNVNELLDNICGDIDNVKLYDVLNNYKEVLRKMQINSYFGDEPFWR